MEALRTPDERFAALPDFPFAPHYVEVADGDGGDAARPLPRRRPARRPGRAADARRAVVVLPVPQDDPDPHRGRPPLHRARPRRLRPFRQADRTRRLHLRAPRRVDARRAVRRARPARRHPRLPGLGRPDRAATRRRAPRSLRARRRREHVPADRRQPPGEAFLELAALLADGRGLRRRLHRRHRAAAPSSRPTSSPRTTRRSPTTRTRPARASSRCSCRRRPTIPRRPRTARRGRRCAAWDKPFLTAFSDRTRSRAAATARSSARCPGCAGQPHTTIEGGGHFLQEDCGEELARVVATGSPASSVDDGIDVIALLDEVRAIAQTGLHYATDPFDRERYEQLLALAATGVRRPIAASTSPRCAPASPPTSAT